jgi:hypothetical protein
MRRDASRRATSTSAANGFSERIEEHKLRKNSESGEALQRFYRSPMLVPGTGHDPVTSCFSDTRSTN